MRRLVVIATALAVLAGAVSAYAATGGFNTYTAKIAFAPNKAGSGKAPAAIGFTEQYVAGGTAGNRTAPLTDITTKLYGVTSNPKSFPTCTQAQIANAKSDAGCPKGALIATGSITAIVGSEQQSGRWSARLPARAIRCCTRGTAAAASSCSSSSTSCRITAATAALITTGTVGPFVGSVKIVGKTLIQDTPIPSSVSFPVAGLEGSLTSETLHYLKLTKTVNGKTVAFNQSVGCKNGKRPYSVTFTPPSRVASRSPAPCRARRSAAELS